MPQAYMVSPDVKTAADLKGKKLSATGGGVGGFNWRMGREILHTAGLTVDDAHFISAATAGRLPGLLTGQIDGVALHPEDVYLAKKQKPSLNLLVQLADLMPNYMFNAYGASLEWIARDRALLRDTAAAMIEANRAMFRDKAKVVPIIEKATDKPKEAVEYAIDVLTKNCVWSVNTGFDPARTQWSIDNSAENGDIDKDRRRRSSRSRIFNSPRRRSRPRTVPSPSAIARISACSGKVGTGFPNRACAKPKRSPMNIQTQRPSAHQPWEQVRTRLDHNAPFSNMHETPYYRDAVYDYFSKQEYQRRYRALREKMREHKLDCVIVPGGPSHWSFGGGKQWLTGHWEWHAISSYVLVPLDGEPTLVFSMGGTHAEACRRECANALSDVRHSRNGKYAEVMVERLK